MTHVLAVDTLNSLFFLHHNHEADPIWKFVHDLRGVMNTWKINKTVLCCDRGQSQYRLNLYPDYKKDRRERRELETPENKERLDKFFKEVVEKFIKIAPMFGFEVAGISGVEADDIISYFSRTVDATTRVAIMSSDTDLLQLLRPGVIQRSYGDKMKLFDTDIPVQVWINEARFIEASGMTPYQYMEAKSISGDKGDSIYSPEGIGEGQGMKLIRRYGSIEEVEKNKDSWDVPRFPEKYRNNLREEFWMVHRNKELINLLHDESTYRKVFGEKGIATLEDIKKRLPEAPSVDEKAIKEWLFENGKVNIYNNFGEWSRPLFGTT